MNAASAAPDLTFTMRPGRGSIRTEDCGPMYYKMLTFNWRAQIESATYGHDMVMYYNHPGQVSTSRPHNIDV